MEANTKEQLLAYFKTLDVATLERLQKYSKLLIIPDEDLLVNATMSQMVEKAHSLADTLFPEWTDRSKSDFGEFLVELFALFSEKSVHASCFIHFQYSSIKIPNRRPSNS